MHLQHGRVVADDLLLHVQHLRMLRHALDLPCCQRPQKRCLACSTPCRDTPLRRCRQACRALSTTTAPHQRHLSSGVATFTAKTFFISAHRAGSAWTGPSAEVMAGWSHPSAGHAEAGTGALLPKPLAGGGGTPVPLRPTRPYRRPCASISSESSTRFLPPLVTLICSRKTSLMTPPPLHPRTWSTRRCRPP